MNTSRDPLDIEAPQPVAQLTKLAGLPLMKTVLDP